jgi:hypothetical protein
LIPLNNAEVVSLGLGGERTLVVIYLGRYVFLFLECIYLLKYYYDDTMSKQ